MLDTATYVRIFEANPSDDLVSKRQEAIDVLANGLRESTNVDELLGIGNAIATGMVDGTMPAPLGARIETAIKTSSPAYVLEGNELQALVCGLIAAANAIDEEPDEESWFTAAAVLSAGLWLALSYVQQSAQPKLDQLCRTVQQRAQRHLATVAEASRLRKEIPKAELAWPQPPEAAKIEEAFEDGITDTIDALRTNAVLDREEIDLLWWALGDRSSLLDQQLSAVSPVQAAIAAAVELGSIVRRPPADAHKHLALRHMREDQHLSLSELLAELEPVRAKFALPSAAATRMKRCPRVFPLMYAISGERDDTITAGEARPLSDWCARALLESAVLRLLETPRPSV